MLEAFFSSCSAGGSSLGSLRSGAWALFCLIGVGSLLGGCGSSDKSDKDEPSSPRDSEGQGAGGESSMTECKLPTETASCAQTPAPSAALIDFATLNGSIWGDPTMGALTGGVSPYQGPKVSAFEQDTRNGTLRVSGSIPRDQYAGLALWFTTCSDLSALADGTATSGLHLALGGDLGGARLNVQVQTETNFPADPANGKGSCLYDDCDLKWSQCTAPGVSFTEIPTAPDDADALDIAWADFGDGAPDPGTDGYGVVGLQIQFECTDASSCDVDVELSTISLLE